MRDEGKGYLGEPSGINPRVLSFDHNTLARAHAHSFDARLAVTCAPVHECALMPARAHMQAPLFLKLTRMCFCGVTRMLCCVFHFFCGGVTGEAWYGFCLEERPAEVKATREKIG